MWSMVPAGEATDHTLDEFAKYASKGDILVDGANSYFRDSIRRHDEAKERLSAAQRVERRPAVDERRTQPGCEAVSQQATGGKQEQRVPEPEIDLAR